MYGIGNVLAPRNAHLASISLTVLTSNFSISSATREPRAEDAGVTGTSIDRNICFLKRRATQVLALLHSTLHNDFIAHPSVATWKLRHLSSKSGTEAWLTHLRPDETPRTLSQYGSDREGPPYRYRRHRTRPVRDQSAGIHRVLYICLSSRPSPDHV